MNSNGPIHVEAAGAIRMRFLELTGLNDVTLVEEKAGPEVFLRFEVSQDVPLYRHAVAIIDRELDPNNAFHGRLSLKVLREKYNFHSKETDVLRFLIARSLRVTSGQISEDFVVEFVPFRGHEEQTIVQPANHVILGRRGVGKSSLI